MRTIRRTLVLGGLGALLLFGTAAHGWAAPTCSDFEPLDVEVHGQHVLRDYVVGGEIGWPPEGGVGAAVGGQRGPVIPGGPGPGFHFEHGFAPGASFCLPQAQSPGFHAGD